jgi:hypothetical protein
MFTGIVVILLLFSLRDLLVKRWLSCWNLRKNHDDMIKQLTAQRNQFKESHVHALAIFWFFIIFFQDVNSLRSWTWHSYIALLKRSCKILLFKSDSACESVILNQIAELQENITDHCWK